MKTIDEIIDELYATNEEYNIISDQLSAILTKLGRLKQKIAKAMEILPESFNTGPKREAELRKRKPILMQKYDRYKLEEQKLRLRMQNLEQSQTVLQSILKAMTKRTKEYKNYRGGYYGLRKRNFGN